MVPGLYFLVAEIVNGNVGAYSLADSLDHHLVVGAGETDGSTLADAGGKDDGFGTHFDHLLGAVDSALAGAAATADNTHYFNLDIFGNICKTALVQLCNLKIGSAGAHILGLHAANETNLHVYILLKQVFDMAI